MDAEYINVLHHVELEILKDFDEYCKEHDIKYSLYAGTMLGAVRHKGFIPWDDDIDVCMTRCEYRKFQDSLSSCQMEGYYFENYETDQLCGTCHGKLRKLNTLFLQEGDIDSAGHHEIWLDVFPLDKMPLGSGKKKVRKFGRQLILLTRANVDRTTDSTVVKLARNLVRVIPKPFRSRLLRSRTRYLEEQCRSLRDGYVWVSMSTLTNIDTILFPKSTCESYTKLTFESKSFMSFKDYPELLSIIYGDYMELPPLEERTCRHKPVKVTV